MDTHGFLEGIVCTDGLGLPIPFAEITIYCNKTQALILSLRANESGEIGNHPLPCPARAHRPAYAYYDVVAVAQGYQTHRETVPIFEGVTTYTSFALKRQEKLA